MNKSCLLFKKMHPCPASQRCYVKLRNANGLLVKIGLLTTYEQICSRLGVTSGPCIYRFFVFKFANEKRITNSFFVFRFQICERKTNSFFVFKSEVRKTNSFFVFAFRMLRSQCHFGWPVKIGSFGGILQLLAAF